MILSKKGSDDNDQVSWSVAEINQFLEKLDNSKHSFSEWEIDFIGKNLDRNYFTPEQRKVIFELNKKYHV